MTAVATFNAKPRGYPDWLPFLQAALQELDDGIAGLVGYGLTDNLVFAADAVASASNVALSAGSATALSIDISTTGKSVTLPDATLLVEGRFRTIFNSGANAYAILDYEGGTVREALGAGETAVLWLEDGSDSSGGGTWRCAVIPASLVDQTARDMAVAALVEANAAGVAGPKGPLVLVDPFTADSLDISDEATYDSGGDYYHNPEGTSLLADGAGTPIGDMTSGGGNAAAFDGTTSQAAVAGARKNSTTSAYIGKDWGSGTTRIIGRYIVYGSSDSGLHSSAASVTAKLQGSTTGAWAGEQVDLHSDTFSDSNGVTKDYTSGIVTTTAYRYHRLLLSATSGEFYVAEVRFYEQTISGDMVLQEGGGSDGNGELTTADPNDMAAWFLIEPVDAITLGTDIVGKLSCDGGNTWATGDWTKVGDFDGKELWRLDADVSAQSGDVAAFRLEGANNAEWRLHACGGVLPIY